MRIALYAPFSSFAGYYSLSHVVHQQARAMLARGHDVEIWTLKNLVPEANPLLAGIFDRVKACIRQTIWTPDMSKPESAGKVQADLTAAIERFEPEVIITHDALFSAHYIDSARAIHQIAEQPQQTGVKWFHYCHSCVTSTPIPHNEHTIWRRTLPPRHTLIYPNSHDVALVARYYSTTPDRVVACPNVHDSRHLWPMDPLAEKIATATDLFTREVVQVFPFCATRAESKGLPQLLQIFDRLADRTDSLLILADACANHKPSDDAVNAMVAKCRADVFRTSSITRDLPDSSRSLPHRATMDLMRCSNVFVFPSLGEACPLAMAEAMAAGCVLAINENVPGIDEYAPKSAIRFNLPALGRSVTYAATVTTRHDAGPDTVQELTGDEAQGIVFDQVADRVLASLRSCPAHQAKTAARRFSLESVGRRLEEIIR